MKDSDPIEVLVSSGQSPSIQRNTAAREATGNYLYFLDNDCSITRETILAASKLLDENESISLVGGPAVTRRDAGLVEAAFGEAMASRIGSFITRSRHAPVLPKRRVLGEELTLCNLMVRRAVYLTAAGLRPGLHPGEDPEFLKRLSSNGLVCMYDPEMRVERPRRKDFKSFATQFFRYGRGRARHIFEGLRARDCLFFIPAIFVLGLIVLTLSPSRQLAPVYTVYAALCLLTGLVSAGRTRRPAFLLLVPLSLLVMHVSYGIGLLTGLLPVRPKSGSEEVEIRIIRNTGSLAQKSV